MTLGLLIPNRLGSKYTPLLKEWQRASPEVLAEIWERHEGANVALRFDDFVVLDPDDQAACDLLDSLEKEGHLPPTVTWKTWRNRTPRLYRGLNNLRPVKSFVGSPVMLEIRTGAGMLAMIPPSQVNGRPYQYLPHLSPQDLQPAELPQEAVNLILKALKRPELRPNPHGLVGCPLV